MSRLSLPRLLAVAGVVVISIGVLLFGNAAGATPVRPQAAAKPAPSCMPGSTCVTIPSRCPHGTACPTVTVGPTSGLGANQWIYVNLADFPPSSTAYIYFCKNKAPVTVAAPPHCVLEGTPALTYPAQQLPIAADGTGETSFQTLDDPHQAGDTPLLGEIPGESTAKSVQFYCGDAADPCSVDVVDPGVLKTPPENPTLPLPTDTAVVPLGFASQDGCAKATLVSTDSDFSVDWLLPAAATVACDGKQPAIPTNTETTTSSILPLLSTGTIEFLDDPQAPDVAAAIKAAHDVVIPMAASAVVMGYVAGMSQNGITWPFNAFELTPNQVAGVMSDNYQGPFNGDLVKCATGMCSAMEGLNSVTGYVAAGEYGAFIPSEESGVVDMLTDWICNAPNVPFELDGKEIHDPNVASKTFTTSVDYPKTWPIKKCTTIDQLPALPTPAVGLFNSASKPATQVKYLRLFAPPAQFQMTPVAGFAPMDWGDSRYNGLDTASLQNAAGQFVAPTNASITAQIDAEQLTKSGYPLPNPKLKVKGGYPLATVIDAVVPDHALGSAVAVPNSEMLEELLNYTTSSGQLPGGYVALPSRLAKIAQTELNAALKAESAPVSTATTTTLSISPLSSSPGASVTLTATVTAVAGTPEGVVDFDLGSATLCSATLRDGSATCSTSEAPEGTDTITATYTGTSDFESSSGSAILTVTSQTTATTAPPTTGATTVTTSPPSTSSSVATTSTTQANVSLADITLAATDARLALPLTLVAGLALFILSLSLALIGRYRRKHGDQDDG
jgi:hypothetical protein